MPSILAVDDTPSILAAVSKLMEGLGFQVAEARDGVEGLAALTECRFDLVILDVTMPNMDGPAMLAKMREGGDGTPVIMLTAESHRPTIAGAMKSGIADYVIKPFDLAELRRKVISVLQRNGCGDVVANSVPGGAPAAGLWERREPSRRKQFVDLMVIDDMENACKRLQGMLPRHVTMNSFTCAQSALVSTSERVYRAILIDTDIPDIDSVVLAQQMRQLQPNAAIAALAVRTNATDQPRNLMEQGFGAVLYKPFTQDEVGGFLAQYLETPQEFLSREGNVLTLAPFAGKSVEHCERYCSRLSLIFPAALTQIACASYSEAIVDLGGVSIEGDLLPKLLAAAAAQARGNGMSMLAVGSGALRKALATFEGTKSIKCFGSVQEARAAGA
jgi:two-component system cell cycle response regulator